MANRLAATLCDINLIYFLPPGGAEIDKRDLCDRTPLASAIAFKQTGEKPIL